MGAGARLRSNAGQADAYISIQAPTARSLSAARLSFILLPLPVQCSSLFSENPSLTAPGFAFLPIPRGFKHRLYGENRV